MKEINLKADAMTRAAQIAAGALKRAALDRGTKFSEFRIRGDRSAIKRYLNEHPEILERAADDVARFSKLRTFAQRKRR